MTAQFAHLNHVAQKAPRSRDRNGDRHWSVKQALDEVTRVTSSCAHVAEPQAPIWHRGTREEVETAEQQWRNQARQRDGKRKIRSDSPSLACAVVSLPREREEDWVAYRDSVVEYFSKKYGPRVVGVAEHTDEAQFHIHLFLVPLANEEFGTVHPGIEARTKARALSGNHVRIEFVRAMRKWQDELWENTARIIDLERTGPKRSRESRRTVNDERCRRDATARVEEAELRLTEIQNENLELRRDKNHAEVLKGALEERNSCIARELEGLMRLISSNRELWTAYLDSKYLQLKENGGFDETTGHEVEEDGHVEDFDADH